jgi:hypothetical protein
MPRQLEAELAQILRDLNKSFGDHRKLVLLDEAKADPKLAPQYRSNGQQLGIWIQARYATDEAPFNVERLRRAVAMIHKSDPNILKWMSGKKPLPLNPNGAVMVKNDAPKGNVQNTQADIIQRGEEAKQAKVNEAVLAAAQGRCANITSTHHSATQAMRRACLAEFARLSALPGATPQTISKGVDIFIINLTKAKVAGPRIHGI